MPTLSATLVSRMSLMKGAYSYSGFPKPVTASVRSTAAKGQVMPSSRAVGNVYPLDGLATNTPNAVGATAMSSSM